MCVSMCVSWYIYVYVCVVEVYMCVFCGMCVYICIYVFVCVCMWNICVFVCVLYECVYGVCVVCIYVMCVCCILTSPSDPPVSAFYSPGVTNTCSHHHPAF